MLVEQRFSWHKEFEQGLESVYLEEYKKIRFSNSNRMPIAIERLCEYILWLEDKVNDQ